MKPPVRLIFIERKPTNATLRTARSCSCHVPRRDGAYPDAGAADPAIGAVGANLDDAKRLAVDERFDEAIARAEEAIRKMKALRDAPVGQPDLVVVAINGDGNRVVITVKNQGTADLVLVERIGPTQQIRRQVLGFNVRLINATTNRPFDPNQPLIGSYTGSLAPGQTRQVAVGPITGCGGQPAKIKGIAFTRVTESNTNNNDSEVITVKGGPCGS